MFARTLNGKIYLFDDFCAIEFPEEVAGNFVFQRLFLDFGVLHFVILSLAFGQVKAFFPKRLPR